MIHCINLNATLDTLHGSSPTSSSAASTVGGGGAPAYPGGKGNNAARAVATAGPEAQRFTLSLAPRRRPAAGSASTASRDVLPRLQTVPGQSRPCLVILDAAKNQETVINSPSQLKLKQSHADAVLAKVLKAVKPGDIISIGGSLPEGLRPDTYAQFVRRIQAEGGVCLLDCYGPALTKGVEAAPFLIKPNADELGEAFGLAVRTREQVLKAAKAILRRGVRCVIVTLGDRGAVAVSHRETLYVAPLPTPRGLLSPVGCGDSFMGGLAWGLHSGKPLADCLRWATASAWANLSTPGAAFFAKKLVKAQVKLVKVSRVAS